MDELSAWLIALPITEPRAFTAAFVDRLLAAGIPLSRFMISFNTMHPEILVVSMIWTAEGGVEVRHNPYERERQPYFLASPMAAIQNGASELRRRLVGPDRDLDFPICRELAAAGATDYAVFALPFADRRRVGVTLTTHAPGGFDDAGLALVRTAVPALARTVELVQAYFATETLLQVYLGANAARRVLEGQFLRGSGTQLRAAVWTCDLRGFTALSDRRPSHEVTGLLDAYFERVTRAIHHHGGEVLKFIGDAVLAIFPAADDPSEACARALRAAREVVADMDAWNRGRDEPLLLGIALHVGEVFYGNVGGHDRLDFTVIGAAVNEVCRLEPLCKLGLAIVMSDRFRAHVHDDDIVDLGERTLRGVAAAVRVHGIGNAPIE